MRELVVRADGALISWTLLGHDTCRHAWKVLHSLGSPAAFETSKGAIKKSRSSFSILSAGVRPEPCYCSQNDKSK